MKNWLRRLAAASVTLAAAVVVSGAFAQYPSKPIRVIVPFPPGGGADNATRIVGLPLSQALGQPILVENRAGADGAIAADAVIKSAPDGYTLFFGTNTALVAVPVMRKNPPYDSREAFTPIGLIGRFVFFAYINPSVPANTVAEFIQYARSNPGKLNYGSGNSTAMVATVQMMRLAGINMVRVPYKGDAPAIADLLAGRVQFAMITTASAMSLAKEGRLRILATLLPERSSLAPDAPTLVEAGLSGVSVSPWASLLGPAKMPREVVDRLSRELNVVLKRTDVREQLSRQAFEAEGSSPEAMTAFLAEQIDSWGRAVKEAGIEPD
jgi:tripartite-type tricarboxylate transporter receptor subunit TctC